MKLPIVTVAVFGLFSPASAVAFKREGGDSANCSSYDFVGYIELSHQK
jgi:hypothetical protein